MKRRREKRRKKKMAGGKKQERVCFCCFLRSLQHAKCISGTDLLRLLLVGATLR